MATNETFADRLLKGTGGGGESTAQTGTSAAPAAETKNETFADRPAHGTSEKPKAKTTPPAQWFTPTVYRNHNQSEYNHLMRQATSDPDPVARKAATVELAQKEYITHGQSSAIQNDNDQEFRMRAAYAGSPQGKLNIAYDSWQKAKDNTDAARQALRAARMSAIGDKTASNRAGEKTPEESVLKFREAQAAFEAAKTAEAEAKKRWKEAGGKVDIGKTIWKSAVAGASGIANAGYSLLDALTVDGGFGDELATILGIGWNDTIGQIDGIGPLEVGDGAISRANQANKLYGEAKREEAYKAAGASRAAQNAAKYNEMIVQAVPYSVAAILSGGVSAAPELAAAAGAQSAPVIERIARATLGMMKNPNWKLSFIMSLGPSYEDAKADGASDDGAALYAILNGWNNATIEVGGLADGAGGLQALPEDVRGIVGDGNRSKLLQYAKSLGKSTVGEIGEELQQGVAENALRPIYGKNVPLYSLTDEQAIINPNRMAEEAKGAAVVSGVLGAGQTVAQNAYTDLIQRATGANTQRGGNQENSTKNVPASEQTPTQQPKQTKAQSSMGQANQTAEGASDSAAVSRVKYLLETETDFDLPSQVKDEILKNRNLRKAFEEITGVKLKGRKADIYDAMDDAAIEYVDNLDRQERVQKLIDNAQVGKYYGSDISLILTDPKEIAMLEDVVGEIPLEGMSEAQQIAAVKNALKEYAKNNPASKTEAEDTTTAPVQEEEQEDTQIPPPAQNASTGQNGELNLQDNPALQADAENDILKGRATDNLSGFSDKQIRVFETKPAIKTTAKDWAKVKDARIDYYRGVPEAQIPMIDAFVVAEYNKLNTAYRYIVRNSGRDAFEIIGKYKVKNSYANLEGEKNGGTTDAGNSENAFSQDPGSERGTLGSDNRRTGYGGADAGVQGVAGGLSESGVSELPYEITGNSGNTVNPSQQTDGGSETKGDGAERERGFSANIASDTNREAQGDFQTDPETYRQLTNKQTLEKAEKAFSRGLEEARKEVEDALNNAKVSNKKVPPYIVPLAKMVSDELYRTGNPEAGRIILADLAAELTYAGQFSQAAIILRNTDNMAVKRAIDRVLDRVNQEARRKGFDWRAELTPAEIDLINSTDFTAEGAYEKVYEQIAERIGAEMPSTVWEKLTEIRRINMLLRPRTMIKNFASNVPMVGLRKGAETLSAAIQTALVKIGGMTQEQQTRAFARDKTLAREYFDTHKEEILRGGNKWDINAALRENRTIFKGNTLKQGGALQQAAAKLTGKEYTSFMEAMRQVTYALLEKGDAPFVRSAFVDNLAQYCQAKGIKTADGITQEAVNFAMSNAMEATFKNASIIATTLNNLKRNSDPAVAAAIDIIIPFTTTPINITGLMLNYSPVGLVKLLGKQSGLADKVDVIAKAGVGSALIALGWALRNAGFITGGEDEDKDKAALDKASGRGAYSIGGKVSYDWAQPTGSMLALGAEISDALEGNESWGDAFANALYTAGDSVLNMSIFQNVVSMLKGSDSPTQHIIDTIMKGGATQLIPGLAGDIAKIIDGQVRSTYTGGDLYNDILAKAKANIPGVSKSLPASVNVRGEEVSRGGFAERIFNTLVNPANITRGERSKADEEIYRLYDETGKTDFFPQVSEYSLEIDGNNSPLSGEERTQYQKTQGTTYYKLLNAAMGNEVYQIMDSEAQRGVLNRIKEYAKDSAKRELYEGRGMEYDSDWEDISQMTDPSEYLVGNQVISGISNPAKATEDGYKAADRLLTDFQSLNTDTQEKLLTKNGVKNMYYSLIQLGMGTKDYKQTTDSIKQVQNSELSGSDGGVSDAAVISKLYSDKTDEEKLNLLKSQNLPNSQTGKYTAVILRTEAALNNGISYDKWVELETLVDANKTGSNPSKAVIQDAASKVFGAKRKDLIYSLYKKYAGLPEEEMYDDFYSKDYEAKDKPNLYNYIIATAQK